MLMAAVVLTSRRGWPLLVVIVGLLQCRAGLTRLVARPVRFVRLMAAVVLTSGSVVGRRLWLRKCTQPWAAMLVAWLLQVKAWSALRDNASDFEQGTGASIQLADGQGSMHT